MASDGFWFLRSHLMAAKVMAVDGF